MQTLSAKRSAWTRLVEMKRRTGVPGEISTTSTRSGFFFVIFSMNSMSCSHRVGCLIFGTGPRYNGPFVLGKVNRGLGPPLLMMMFFNDNLDMRTTFLGRVYRLSQTIVQPWSLLPCPSECRRRLALRGTVPAVPCWPTNRNGNGQVSADPEFQLI